MELTVPEKVLFETNVYTVENDLRAKKGRVRITEDRVIFEGFEEVNVTYISAIKNIKIQKDDKTGFLLSGSIFLFTSLLLLSFIPKIDSFISAIIHFVFPMTLLTISFLLIYWWKLTRSYLLTLTIDHGEKVGIRSRTFDELLEIANAVELVRIGAVKRLSQKKNF